MAPHLGHNNLAFQGIFRLLGYVDPQLLGDRKACELPLCVVI